MARTLKGRTVSNASGDRSHTFLLRCWEEPDGGTDGQPVWRFSMTRIDRSREPKGFADLEAVVAYLRQILTTQENEPLTPG